MTSLYLNSSPSSFPAPDLNQDQNLHNHLFSNSFFNNTPPQFQSEFLPNFGDHHQVVDYISQSRLSDPKVYPSSSSWFEAAANQSNNGFHKRDEDEGMNNNSRGIEGSAKWIPSKMRIMQKMINSNCSSETDHKPLKYALRFQDHHANYNESCNDSSSQSIIRVCSDCNTTSTPLWRSGPKGPKTLCNACGIRQRKARRAMAAAEAAVGNGMAVAAAETKLSNKVQNMKEKKLRTSHVTQCKKSCKSPDYDHLPHKPNISFKNFGFNFNESNTDDSALHLHHPVLPQDVEQAAILLMELSCGFVHV